MLHIASLDLKTVLNCAKTYLLQGVGIFLAVSPLIALVSKLKRGYWLALIFAEIYSFLGLFLGNGALRYIYPITAAFCISGYYKTTPHNEAFLYLAKVI